MSVTVASSVDDLRKHQSAWLDLARNSVEPNIFFEPALLLAAIECLGTEAISVVLVWNATAGILIGLFPVVRRFGYRGLPFHYLSIWEHAHSFLCTPLVRKGSEQESFGAFFDWVDNHPRGECLLEMRLFTEEGPYNQELKQFLNSQNRKVDQIDSYERACFHASCCDKQDFAKLHSSKLRKDLRSKQRKLEKVGKVDMVHFGAGDNLEEWIDEFISLEKSGWKGRNASAIGCSQQDLRFFKQAVKDAHSSNQLRLVSLRVNQKAVAMKCGFRRDRDLFLFKIAYDEKYAQSSPGLLLEYLDMQSILDDPTIENVDSCAAPVSRLFNRLMPDRKRLSYINVSTAHPLSRLALSVVPITRNIYHRFVSGGDHFGSATRSQTSLQ